MVRQEVCHVMPKPGKYYVGKVKPVKDTEYAVIGIEVVGCLARYGAKMPRIAGCWHFVSLDMKVKKGPPRGDAIAARADAPKGARWVRAQTAKEAEFKAKQLDLFATSPSPDRKVLAKVHIPTPPGWQPGKLYSTTTVAEDGELKLVLKDPEAPKDT